MKNIQHKNIARCYGFTLREDNDEYTLHIAYELCQSRTFEDYLEEHGQLSEEDALKFFKQIFSALTELQNLGGKQIQHKDLKPSNLLMSIEGDLKLTDLGRAREALVNVTKRYGTPFYRAPEIHFFPNKASETCDFWSLGVILYQMVVGKMPFIAANEHNLFKKIKSTAA